MEDLGVLGDFDDLLRQLAECAQQGKNTPLTELARALNLAFVTVETWPADVLDRVVRLLETPAFLQLRDSWKLLSVVIDNWELLSADEMARLRAPLVGAFDRYGDFTGAMLTSEALGERYADQLALQDLCRLGRAASMPARALVPRGLEVLARTTEDRGLRDEAVKALRVMLADPEEEVRRETELALAKVTQG